MKKELKGFICGIVVTALVGCGVSAAGLWDRIDVLRNDIKVIANGETITADNFLYNDTTYLPIRAVAEALGQPISYDETTNTAYLGEKRSDEIVSKYIPPNDPGIMVYIKEQNGKYYICAADYILGYDKDPFHKFISQNTNIGDIIYNGATVLTVKDHSWPLTVIDGIPYIPYDTFVDEVEPLLK